MITVDISIGVIGLGYVGLPLFIAFSEKFPTLGFDIDANRIQRLRNSVDDTAEVCSSKLTANIVGSLTCHEEDLSKVNFYVITVPTPVDGNNCPDFSAVLAATTLVAKYLKEGDTVVYESTVYPGATEELCLPILEQISGLSCLSGDGIKPRTFSLGYSPERVNPGDKVHTVDKITKVISGSSRHAVDLMDRIYGAVITAGTFKATSIKVAEAAKVIENTQRDLNIALMNEISKICNLIGIDTKEVIDTASTKWNFNSFSPGLVGGHCIGVDPYYLTYKARKLGYVPAVILAGRSINDGMPAYVFEMINTKLATFGATGDGRPKIGFLGITFKENVPDIRNSKNLELLSLLASRFEVFADDPLVANAPLGGNYTWTDVFVRDDLDVIVIAVPHNAYRELTLERYVEMLAPAGPRILVDLKSIFSLDQCKSHRLNTIRL